MPLVPLPAAGGPPSQPHRGARHRAAARDVPPLPGGDLHARHPSRARGRMPQGAERAVRGQHGRAVQVGSWLTASDFSA